jgi:hypothetical protein
MQFPKIMAEKALNLRMNIIKANEILQRRFRSRRIGNSKKCRCLYGLRQKITCMKKKGFKYFVLIVVAGCWHTIVYILKNWMLKKLN